MKWLKLSCCALLTAFAAATQASVLYSFAYTADPGKSSVPSFSFSFSVPDILSGVPIASVPVSPFTVSDGTSSWTFTQGHAGFWPDQSWGCFGFGTSDTIVEAQTCGVHTFTGSGALEIRFFGGLPATVGTFTPDAFDGHFDPLPDIVSGPPADAGDATGTFTLTITDGAAAPEPSTIALFMTAAALAFACVRRRPGRHLSCA